MNQILMIALIGVATFAATWMLRRAVTSG